MASRIAFNSVYTLAMEAEKKRKMNWYRKIPEPMKVLFWLMLGAALHAIFW